MTIQAQGNRSGMNCGLGIKLLSTALRTVFASVLLLWMAMGSVALGQGGLSGVGQDAELVETRTEVPKLKAAAAYAMKDNTLDLELSEYAGYAGLVVANSGLEPSEDSIFFKKHGFKVRITISESESWSALNSGRIGASATTADVLAVYGKQFSVVVPAQIGYSRGADAVVTQTGIKKINDLKGKVLASVQFTEADFFIRYLAQEAGLEVNLLADMKAQPDAGKVNLIYCGDAEGAAAIFSRDLKSGRNRLAGCVGWAPFTSDTVENSDGKAHILASNRNILVVADVLIVNKGFAAANPKILAGLVQGLIEGNRQVRDNPDQWLDLIGKAFKWNDKAVTKSELGKVHLANLPENLAFFSGAIDAAGSWGGIYQSAVMAYGTDLIKNPIDSEKFLELAPLKALEQAGDYKDQKIAIAPIKSAGGAAVEGDPLFNKNIRFLFEPNSAKLDMANKDNLASLESIKKLLQVSPGSTVMLRGHVDNAMVPQIRAKGGDAMVRQYALRAMALSQDRAKEIKRILAEKYSAEESRLDTVGRGWEEPLGADGDQNRRVEVQWFTIE